MAVLAIREILPRSISHKIGGSPEGTCVWIATLDGPTDSEIIISAIGIRHGTAHPEYLNLTCDSLSLEETDRHHATVTYTYSIPGAKNDPKDPEDPSQPPWFQPDRWTFATTNASVACTTHYVGAGNGNKRAITNTAGDIIVGITKAEAELKIAISGARLQLNLADIKKYVNSINRTAWAGFPSHTVQCVGASATPERLEWDGAVINYWQINIELLYRSSSHDLFLPNVGWNVIANGKKERAWVYITAGGTREKVASPHPVSLNMAGGFLCGQAQDEQANPAGDTTVVDDGTSYYGG